MDWIGWALGIAAIIVAIIIYLATKTKIELSFQERTIELVGGNNPPLPGELEILFNKQLIPRVTKTNLIMWNSGNTTIRGSDIVENDKLRIQFPENIRVLRTTIAKKREK